MRVWTMAVLAIILFAGCIGSETPAPPVAEDDTHPVLVPGNATAPQINAIEQIESRGEWQFLDTLITDECGGTRTPVGGITTVCSEPTVDVAPDGTFVYATNNGDVLARSGDGQNWTLLAPPPRPVGTGAAVSDAHIIFDPQGRLWWSAISLNNDNIIIAQSPDLGDSWDLVKGVGFVPIDQAPEAADRQWLGFAPDGRVLMLCNCPMFTTPLLAWSDDDGETWDPQPAPDLVAHQGPPGPPLFLADGTLLVPFITGGPGGTATQTGTHIAVGVQRADGGFDVIEVTESGDPITCCAWPNMALDSQGRVWLAWAGDTGPTVAVSEDGRTWSEWVQIPAAGDIAYPHPAIEPYGDGMLLAWYDGARPGHVLTWLEPDGNTTHVAVGAAPTAGSDYNDLAVRDDGMVLVPWSDDGAWVSTSLAPDAQA